MDFGKIIAPLSWETLPPEFLSSLLAMIIVMILALVIRIKLKKYDPLKRPSTFMNIVESIVNYADQQVKDLMGPAFEGWGGFILCLGLYIILGFFIGMIGIPNFLQPSASWAYEPLPNPFTNLAMPLSIALVTFGLTHFTAMRCKHWGYFKRYVEPIFLFLPINLITMWSDVLSLTLRLFGNALAGYCVITLIYLGFEALIPSNPAGIAITPVIAPIAHLYFDLFDGFIQLAVFCMLTMINISSEYVSKEDYELMQQEKISLREAKRQKKLEKKQRKALEN